MQIVLEDEVKRSNGRRIDAVGFVVCAGRDSRHVKREYDGGAGGRGGRIQVSRGFFDMFKEEIQGRRRRGGKGNRAEKARARGKDNGRVCAGV